jgi:hypothetical protein
MHELPARTVGAFRALESGRARARVRNRRFLVTGFAAAAAALIAVTMTGSPPEPTSNPTAAATATPTATATATPTATATATATPIPTAKPAPSPRRWKTPDLDTLWDDTSAIALESAAARTRYAPADGSTYGDDDLQATEVALAAWDDAGL